MKETGSKEAQRLVMTHRNHFFTITADILPSFWFYRLKKLISVRIQTEREAQQLIQCKIAVL